MYVIAEKLGINPEHFVRIAGVTIPLPKKLVGGNGTKILIFGEMTGKRDGNERMQKM